MPHILCLVFVIIVSARGYECSPPPSVQVSLNKSAAVFVGEVIAEEYRAVNTDSIGKPATSKALVIKLKVMRLWKGDVDEEVYLYTSGRKYSNGTESLDAEDFRFHKGERYLVYAFRRDGHLQTHGCTRTRRVTEADADLRELGEGELPRRKG